MYRSQSTLQADILAYAIAMTQRTGSAPTSKQIAAMFDISRSTANKHRAELMEDGKWPGSRRRAEKFAAAQALVQAARKTR